MARILLHSCCGPCTIFPLRSLQEQGWSIHGFFYNPHIQPYQEFQRRMETWIALAESKDLPIIVRDEYNLEAFLRHTAFRENQRCLYCYSVRLEATARLAKKSRFDAFTSTLLYSRQQKHDLIRSMAEAASLKYGIAFYYEDFRAGWKQGQEEARLLGMYRQQYCGCIYSEAERYRRSH